jgi:hypothetical protein
MWPAEQHKLTEQQRKNIRLCILRGWFKSEEDYWRDPEGRDWQVMHGYQTYKDGTDILPDHFGDLNEMKKLELFTWGALGDDNYDPFLRRVYYRNLDQVCGDPWESISATAAQRAEAFGRALNLWQS